MSRRNRRDPSGIARLRAAVAHGGILAECSDQPSLAVALADFRARGVRAIAVAGGDGTNHMVLTHALQVYGEAALPMFAFLRGGTMNTVARGIGVRWQSPLQLLRKLTVALLRGTHVRTVQRRCLLAGDQAGFLFGTGAARGFLAEYYRRGEPSPASALRTLGRGVASALVGGATVKRIVEPFEGEVELGSGEKWPWRRYLSVTAGTIADMGLGFRPFYRSEHELHVLGIHASPASFIFGLANIRLGLPLGDKRAYDTTTTHFTVRSNSNIGFMIDGDLCTAGTTLEVRHGPRLDLVVDCPRELR
jgi:diacylglycerol kinase (ATP)